MAADLFSKVARRMWVDVKFCRLSRPQPNAQTLWNYLLTGPHSTPVPGMFTVGELGLAEALEWSPDATRACLEEIVGQQMARVDRRRRLIWLPNALQHNLPRNPKQVLGWGIAWRLLPECELLTEAAAAIRAQLASKNLKLAEAFDRVVSGQAPVVDEADESGEDDAGAVSPVQKQVRSVSDTRRDRYPIQDAIGMPTQEREKEMEKEIPPGGTHAGAREPSPTERDGSHGGRRPVERLVAPGPSAAGHGASDPPTRPGASHAPSQPPREPPATSEAQARRQLTGDALQVYEALLWRPIHWDTMDQQPLRQLATVETARGLASKAGPDGKLELDDVLHAIRQCAEKEAARRDAHEPPMLRDRLASALAGFVDRMHRGEVRRRAEAATNHERRDGWSGTSSPVTDDVREAQRRVVPGRQPPPARFAGRSS